MKVANLVAVIIFFVCQVIFGQVNLEWAVRYDGPAQDWDTALAVVVDDSGNVYVTGASPDDSTTSATIKYSPNGDELWLRKFVYSGADLSLDHNNNLYVTGHLTVRMNSKGDTTWTREWPPFSGSKRVLINSNGNIYLGGAILFDYGVEKLTQYGEVLWTRTFNGPANDDDEINDMILDNKGNIIVTGRSWGIESQWDYLTIKYSSDGDTLWTRRYNGPAPPLEVPTDIAFAVVVDDSDNVYVTGWSDGVTGTPQCFTIKYSPEGDSLWGKRFPSSGNIGYAGYDMLYDRDHIYIAARANGFDDTLLKYDTEGNLVWTAVYPANHTFATNPPRLVKDQYGNIYMSSTDYVDPHAYYIVLKYNPDGSQQWEYRYHPPGSTAFTVNNAYALAVDSMLNIYVTGESYVSGAGASFDYLTLKLSQGPVGVELETEPLPTSIQLFQNYPNPFNSSTRIEYTIDEKTNVSLKVFNTLGQEIKTLINEEMIPGYYSRLFDGKDLSSGVYFYELVTDKTRITKKMILLR